MTVGVNAIGVDGAAALEALAHCLRPEGFLPEETLHFGNRSCAGLTERYSLGNLV